MKNSASSKEIEQVLAIIGEQYRAGISFLVERRIIPPNLTNIDDHATKLYSLIYELNAPVESHVLEALEAIAKDRHKLSLVIHKARSTSIKNAVSWNHFPLFASLEYLSESTVAAIQILIKSYLYALLTNQPIHSTRNAELVKALCLHDNPSFKALSDQLKSYSRTPPSSQKRKFISLSETLRSNVEFLKQYPTEDIKHKDAINLLSSIVFFAPSITHRPKIDFSFLAPDQKLSKTNDHRDDLYKIPPEVDSESLNIATDEGLSEFDLVDPIEVARLAPIGDRAASYRYLNSYAHQTKRKNAMRAQFLDNDWDKLTDLEFNTLSQTLATQLNTDHPDHKIALCVALSFLTHAEPLFWWDWPLIDQLDIDQAEHNYAICLKQKIWVHKTLKDKRFWQPNKDQNSLVEKVNSHLPLPLPEEVITALQPLVSELNAQTLGEAISLEKETITSRCNEWLKDHLSLGREIQIAKVRNALYLSVTQRTMDETLAATLCAQPILSTPQGISYTTLQYESLWHSYLETFNTHFSFAPFAIPQRWTGSLLKVKQPVLTEALQYLQQNAAQKLANAHQNATRENVFAAHNEFVSFCIIQALINTGHRDNAEDPFARLCDFVFEHNGVFISDKIMSRQHETRLVFYSDAFKAQLQDYQQHLKQLAYWLERNYVSAQELSLAHKIHTALDTEETPSIPLFFYLDENDESLLKRINPSQLKAKIPQWQLPFNVGRHLLATQLRLLNVNPEYINYQLGHISHGEHPFADSSVLNVHAVKTQLLPALNQIHDQLKIQNLRGLDFQFKRSLALATPELPDSKLTYQALGPIRRLSENRQLNKQYKNTVNEVFNQYILCCDPAQLTQDLVQLAFEKLLQAGSTQPQKKIVLFIRALKQYISHYHLNLHVPQQFIELQPDPSPFQYKNIALRSKRQRLVQHFLKDLEQDNETLNSTLTPIAKLVLSIILSGYYTHQNRFESLLKALQNQQYLITEHTVFIEITVLDNQTERISLDPISALLLHQWRKGQHKPIQWRSVKAQIKHYLAHCSTLHFDQLLQATRIEARLQLPAMLCPVLSGERQSASLNRSSFLRVLHNTRLERPAENDSDIQADTYLSDLLTELAPAPEHQTPNSLKKAFKQLKQIKHLLYQPGSRKRPELTSAMERVLESWRDDQNVSTTLQLIGTWAKVRLNTSERVSQLKFSSVQTYFSLIANDLLEHWYDINPLELDEEECIAVYNVILQGSKEPETTAAQLIHFHNHIITHYAGIDTVDRYDLQIDQQNDEAIDANFISSTEYQQVFNTLLNDPAYKAQDTHHIALQQALIFMLTCKLGLRVNEVYKLEVRDLFLPNEHTTGYIINRVNRLGSQKTASSLRCSLFHGRLSEKEISLLQKWYELRNTINQQHSTSLWLSDTVLEKLDPFVFKHRILQVLRVVTNDPTLKLRSLRHTCATQELFQQLNAVQHLSTHTSLNDALYDTWLEPEQNNQLLYGHNNPTRRSSYRLARQLGHAGTQTTLTNYTHLYEFVIPIWQGALLNQNAVISNKLLYALSSAAPSHIRVLKTRKSKKQSHLSLSDIEKVVSYENGIYLKKDKFRPNEVPFSKKMLPEMKKNFSENFSLISLEKILFLASQEIPVEKIAFRFSVHKNQILNLLILKEKLDQKSGLSTANRRGYVPTTKNEVKKTENSQKLSLHQNPILGTHSNASNSLNLEKLLYTTDQNMHDRKKGHQKSFLKLTKKHTMFMQVEKVLSSTRPEFLQLWKDYINPRYTGWYFETPMQLEMAINFFSHIGVKAEKIVIGTNKRPHYEATESEAGIHSSYSKESPQKPNAVLFNAIYSTPVNGLFIQANDKRHFENQIYNQLCFLLNLQFDYMEYMNGKTANSEHVSKRNL